MSATFTHVLESFGQLPTAIATFGCCHFIPLPSYSTPLQFLLRKLGEMRTFREHYTEPGGENCSDLDTSGFLRRHRGTGETPPPCGRHNHHSWTIL